MFPISNKWKACDRRTDRKVYRKVRIAVGESFRQICAEWTCDHFCFRFKL